ncbi:hypothetical protein HRbin06_00722 [archaeon HR06]|nr:hypothetical protein HRbin06_00722 [archaeon HR06]
MSQLTESKYIEELENFLKTFNIKGNYKYRERLDIAIAENKMSLVVDYDDLLTYDVDLATKLIQEPDKLLPAFDQAAYQTLRYVNPDYAEQLKRDSFKVRIRGLPQKLSVRKVGSKELDKFISVSGMVVRTSELKPLIIKGVFRCLKCGSINEERQTGLILKKPSMCKDCNEKKSLELDVKNSEFIDYQIIRIQELPEELPPGQLPQSFDVSISGDIVGLAKPGDRVIVNGIVRAEPETISRTSNSRIFKLRIEGNYVEILGKELETFELTREDEEEIKSIASKPNAYDMLIQSVAPSIYGYETQKEAILLQLAGSPQITLSDGSTLRGDINILLIGDPGTAKSELLKYVARLAPRGLYTSGKGSTAAGLTAAVIREKSGIMMLEAGAVVLADQGIACITEDTEIYTGHSLIPVRELWDNIKSPVYITKSGREAKRTIIPIGVYNNRTDIPGFAFAIMRRRYKGEIVKITLSSGLTLRVTPDHLLRTNLKNPWIRADKIKPGDELRGPTRLFKPSIYLKIAEDEGYTLGCIYGSSNINQFRLSEAIQEGYYGIVSNLGGYTLLSNYTKEVDFLLQNSSLDNILLFPDRTLWAFLAGIFDTKGELLCIKDKIIEVKLYISKSKHELLVLLYALRRLGIYAKLQKDRKGFFVIQILDLLRFLNGIKPYSVRLVHKYKIYNKKKLRKGVEKVVKVEREYYDGYVYDLSVNKYHNYEVALVYVHNCIDEFDKMRPEDRSALHEAMEQQTVSVAKGGIVTTLSARTSILAAANPVFGKYDPRKNITDNINIPIPLLTRFDLIFVLRDIPDRPKDEKLARFLLEQHKKAQYPIEPPIGFDKLRKYILYSKRINPILTKEAEEKLLEYYLQLRGSMSEDMISITPRQLESLIRLAKARARILLREKVTEEDALRSISLIRRMLETVGIDVKTGKVDLGVLHGKPLSERSQLMIAIEVFKQLEGPQKNPVEEKTFIEALVNTKRFTEEEAKKMLRNLINSGQIYESKPGYYNKL